MSADPTVLTLIGTLCGGIGIKILDNIFSRRKMKFDDASRIRDELRMEITSQREEIIKLETERDKYRDAYYALMREFNELQTELTLALHGIKEQVQQAEAKSSPPPPNPLEEPKQ